MGRFVLSILSVIVFLSPSFSQSEGYIFKEIKSLATTPVKNQYRSGTCWSFSGVSFFESELIRIGKGEYDLSEMFVVRSSYDSKAKRYVRMHGNLSFTGGGAFNDVTMVYSEIGIVPEEAYSGMAYGENNHIHGELDNIFKSYVESVVENKNKKLTSSWYNGYKALLNAYFGDYPATFTYNGVEYTPESFASHLGLNISDYVMITSFTHHPWYSSFILEVPDNWGWGEVYNVKLEELTDIIDYSINQGYTVAWATDVSEKGFSWQRGLAIVPSEDTEDLTGLERAKWDDMSELEKQKALFNFSPARKEKVITSEIRQQAFDNYETTDDHGMHITGLSEDQNGNVFYLVKNSWGLEGSPYKGYLYASKAFVQFKTTSVLVHKNAVPKELKKKIGI